MFWSRDRKHSIHLVGIGGSGMSGIAEVLIGSGFEVSGSDLQPSPLTERLSQLGAKIFYGHRPDNLGSPSCVVVSSAVPANNSEWQEARRRSIPVIPRAEMLAELMRLKKGVAVAGSHGKTTTTSMIGQVLKSLRPTVVVGGRLQHWNASSLVGRGSTFVIEADESDRSFLKFSPVYSVVTNVDLEHLDTYRNLEDIQSSFVEFLNRTAFFGTNWINADCPRLQAMRAQVLKPTKSFGFSDKADLRVRSCRFESGKSFFELDFEGESLGLFEIPVMGSHNVMNAAAAVGVALSLGLSPGSIRRNLKTFIPADRRMQKHGESESWAVVEDYAHHPTEIEAALSSFRLMYPDRDHYIVFQPHRFSRTEFLWDEFVRVLSSCGKALWLLPIYPAHEAPREGINSFSLAAQLKNIEAFPIESLGSPASFVDLIQSRSEGKKLAVLILGAAPLSAYARELTSAFEDSFVQLKRLH